MGVDNSDGDKFKISSSVDVSSNPRLTIDTSGNVGIGTTAGGDKFTVSLGSSRNLGIQSYNNIPTIVSHNDGWTAWGDIGLNYNMIIKDSGLVGIGTTAPTVLLHLKAANPGIYFEKSGTANYSGLRFFTGATADWFIGSREVSPGMISVYSFGSSTEAIRIQRTTGYVGIGTTAPSKPLDVAASGGIRISQTTGSSSQTIIFQDNGQIRSNDDNHRIIFDH